ncbi:MAG: 2,3-bisphosphoglycerate-independent phosphoglycerate mutase [Oscillospiraceae bacterium]|nr:2,3-bisphosphoglycerate-independent phosphoglycerate mutase [Oscillospiraceae bacterium]
MKYILVIGDGMADVALERLNGRTPLEVASKPRIDSLARSSSYGTAVNCPQGLPAGSDTAILSIFGCDPRKYYFGRAPLEAADQGIGVPDGSIAFRCNMACVMPDESGKLVMQSHSAGGIDGATARALIVDLLEDAEYSAALSGAGVTIYPSDSYRHIGVQRGTAASALEMYAPHDNLGRAIEEIMPQGSDNAETLANLVRQSVPILSRHPLNSARVAEGKLPANCVWMWANGTSATLPSFETRYGVRGAVISAVPLCRGIGALQGMEVIRVEGATGELDTNYEGKAAAALAALRRGLDFVAVHIEAPDECTHCGDLTGKIQAIERIDSRFLAPLVDAMGDERFRLLLLSDHYTLSTDGSHGAQPVPFIIYDSHEPQVGVDSYSEAMCQPGETIPDGTALISKLIRH